MGCSVIQLAAALEHIDPEHLIAAADCGLGLLGRELAVQKPTNLATAVKRVSCSFLKT
jgi:methionine synthase II (cobalamin-independent)